MSVKRLNKSNLDKMAKIPRTENNFTEELMIMVRCFNCNELGSLMQFAQKSKSGKKADLVERATNLVMNGCDMPIQIKIKELYNQHCARLKNQKISSPIGTESIRKQATRAVALKKWNVNDFLADSSSSATNSDWSPDNIDSSDSLSSISSIANSPIDTLPSIPPINLKITIKKTTVENGPTHSLVNSIQSLPMPVMAETSWSPGRSTWSPLPQINDVRMLKLPFYDQISQIIKPTLMTKICGICSSMHSFYLNAQNISSIKESRIWHADGVMEYQTQVLLRFAIHNSSVDQDDFFPPRIGITVNNKAPSLPALLPVTKAGVEAKRPNRPVNITQLVRLNAYERNAINVKWDDVSLQDFVISVELAKQLTSSDLLQRLKQFGPRPAELTKLLIKEKMQTSNDNEICATSLRISLICPLSKMRLSVPVRSLNCNHLQCFDASTFIQMNEKKPSWMCPICDRPARYTSLFIDGLFVDILSKVSDTNDVHFMEDGEWLPIFPRKTEKKHVTSDKCVTLISDSPEHNSNNITTVDLTASDDEEDEEMLTRLPSATSVLDDIQALLKCRRDKIFSTSLFDQL